MQPEQQNNNILPPVNDNPVPSTPPPETPPAPEPKGSPKWMWFVIGGVVLIGIIVAIVLVVLLGKNSTPSGDQPKQEPAVMSTVTIGDKPYVYACNVATEADYARIFKLDNTTVGTVYERSALSRDDIAGDVTDLAKISPVSGDRYTASCSYTLAKKDARNLNEIDVDIFQAASEDDITSRYESSRASEADDYTNDGVDNGKVKLGTLPSFPNNSFVVLPVADDTFPEVEASFTSENHLISIKYALHKDETSRAILPLIDEYAKAIQTKLNNYKEGKQVDVTGRQSFVGKKFVDVCKRSGMQNIGKALGDLQLRSDNMVSSSTYGSLEGSRAAGDGAISSCDVEFRTKADQSAQDSAKQQGERQASALVGDALWPHSLGVKTNSFRTPEEARARYMADKADATKPHPNTGAATVTDLAGIGEAAFKSYKETKGETSFSGQKIQETYKDSEFVVLSGSDVISVTLQQTSSQKTYTSQPTTLTDEQFKKLYELINTTLLENRK